MRFRIFPVLIIAVGLGVLFGNLGVIPAADVREFFRTWWPVIPIAFGIALLLRPRDWHHHRQEGGRRACRREGDAAASAPKEA